MFLEAHKLHYIPDIEYLFILHFLNDMRLKIESIGEIELGFGNAYLIRHLDPVFYIREL